MAGSIQYRATPEWRAAAVAAFEAMGHTHKTACARQIKISPSMLTRILSGARKKSSHLRAITTWLAEHGHSIPNPVLIPESSAELDELLDIASRLDEPSRRSLLDVARAFDARRAPKR